MQLRPLATAAAVLALAASLASCGFDYATDRDYAVTSGATNRDGDVDVLSAVVVSAAEGSGTFVASLSNNLTDEPQTFTGVSGAEGATITAAEFDPIEIPAGGLVNLADPPAGIVLTGDFGPGSVVPLTLDFGDGERVSLNVPVVADDTGYWEGMDAS
ncbi:hypothetical protein [Nocardioides sp.]|jgi:hypothetical protein|uniref:hypothetical protein n=1 Tax=Nocardioides sp. TaxID=35761 RepID=UPI002639CDC8|nr:hypothetical protein [Nocardioides sp.]MCW2736025.1 hypothetical protein [Nocardioides sp.]